MTIVRIFVLLLVISCIVTPSSLRRLERSHRPSYAGSTGGTWANYVGQRIPPGTPWPAKGTTSTPAFGTKLNNVPQEEVTSTVETASRITPTKADIQSSTKQDLSSSQPTIFSEYKPFQSTSKDGTSTTAIEQNKGVHSGNGTAIQQEDLIQSYSTEGYKATILEHLETHGYPSPQNQGNKSSNSVTVLVLTIGEIFSKSNDSSSNTILNEGTLGSKGEQKESSGTTPKDIESVSLHSSSTSTSSSSTVLEYKPNRPFFAGATGGTWEEYVGQRVPESTTSARQDESVASSATSTTSRPSVVLDYKPNRPSFAGSTGGTWEGYVGQRIPEGPTNAKKGDSPISSTTSTTSRPSIVLEYKPNRPSFAGSTGGTWEEYVGQRVPESTTSSRQDESVANSATSTTSRPSVVLDYKPNRPSFAGSTGGTWEGYVGQRIPESTTNAKKNDTPISSTISTTSRPSIVLEYKPNRPSFAGSTGGTWEEYVGQRVPESTTSARQDESVASSATSTTSRPSVVLDYKPNRPSFAGSTGGTWEGYVGQRIPESTTNAKKDDSPISSTTSTTSRPSIVLEYKPNRPSFAGSTGGTWEEYVGQKIPESTTNAKQNNSADSSSATSSPSTVLEYKPNRPSFAGSTGGTWEGYVGQRIPETTTNTKKDDSPISSTTSTTSRPSIILEYKPNRPSFAGSTGGTWEGYMGQRVPENTTNTKKDDSVIRSTTSTTSSPSIVLEYKPNRPSFAGSTGGTWDGYVGQRIPESTINAKEEEITSNSTTSTTSRSSVVLNHKPNRPSFVESSTGEVGEVVLVTGKYEGKNLPQQADTTNVNDKSYVEVG